MVGFLTFTGSFMANTRVLKNAKTFEEQVKILEGRNLNIDSFDDAKEFLINNNYYRVSAYFKPYYDPMVGEEFKEWVNIEHIKALYQFDSDLRKLMLPIFEKVEVAFRTHLAYFMAHEQGALAYHDSSNFYDARFHSRMINEIKKVTSRPKEKFLQFYKNQYGSQFPIWVLIEALSFGVISKIYGNMLTADKTKLCNQFYNGLNNQFLKNWIQALVVSRNVCAHHGRLFNREILAPNIPHDMRNKLMPGYEKRIFTVMLMSKELIDNKHMWNHFVYELMYLIDKYNFTHFHAMGLPVDWQQHFVSNPIVLKQIKIKLQLKKIFDKIENRIKNKHI